MLLLRCRACLTVCLSGCLSSKNHNKRTTSPRFVLVRPPPRPLLSEYILWNRVILSCFLLRITFVCPSKFKLKSNFPPHVKMWLYAHFQSLSFPLSFLPNLCPPLSYFKRLHPVISPTIVNKRGLNTTSLAPLWFSIYCLLVSDTEKTIFNKKWIL